MDAFFYDDDYYDYWEYQPTPWERKSERLKVSAPDPEDLCEDCGRSHALCDCYGEEYENLHA